MELIHFFNALWYRKWLIIIVPSLMGILVFFLSANLKKDYKSTARLSAGFTQQNQVSVEDEKIGYYEVEVKFSNLIEKMYSSGVMDFLTLSLIKHDLESPLPFRTVEANNVGEEISTEERAYIIDYVNKNLQPSLMGGVNYNTYREDSLVKEIVERFEYDEKTLKKENISIKRIAFSDYINVVASTENSKLSAFIVNEFCKIFIQFNDQIKIKQSNESIKSLEQLMDAQNIEYNDLTSSLDDSLSRIGGTNPTFDVEFISNQLVQLEGERDDLKAQIELNSRRIEQINNRFLQDDISASNSSFLKKRKLYTNKQKEFNKKYRDSNFQNLAASDSVKHYNRLLGSVQADIDNMNSKRTSKESRKLADSRDDLNIKLKVAMSSYKRKVKEIDDLEGRVMNNEAHSNKFSDLKAKIKVAKEQYERTHKRYREIYSNSLITGSSILIDSFGFVSDKAEPSKRLLFVIGSFFGSFALLVGLIILFELLDFSLKSSNIFHSRTGLNLLGTVLFMNQIKKLGQKVFDKSNEKPISHIEKFTELVRKTRFSIEQSNKKVFLFTSCKAQVGKSFIIRILSEALVLKNKRVLIIDLNFKKNSLSTIFETKKKINFEAGKNDSLMQYIQMTTTSGVDIVGCENLDISPMELLSDNFLGNGIEEVKEIYDYVFIEVANLNEFSDAMDLEKYVDHVVSIFSANETLKFIDEQSIQFFESLGKKYLGSILNRVEYRYIND